MSCKMPTILLLCLVLRYGISEETAANVALTNCTFEFQETTTTQKNELTLNKNTRSISELEIQPISLDIEWDLDLEEKKQVVSPILKELYSAMDEDKKEITKNADLIRAIYNTKLNNDEILYFNVTSITENEEVISEAKLVIQKDIFESGTNMSLKDVIIKVYQILPSDIDFFPNASIYPDEHHLLTVSYIPSMKNNYQIFKVKQSLTEWLNGEPYLRLFITINDLNDNTEILKINQTTNGAKPFLIFHLTSINNNVVPSYENLEENSLQANDNFCTARSFYINFEEIGWKNFIIQPLGFMSNICSGFCDLHSSNILNHIKLLSALRVKGNLNCVPNRLDPLVIMFHDSYYNVIIKKYQNMIVRDCVCK